MGVSGGDVAGKMCVVERWRQWEVRGTKYEVRSSGAGEGGMG